MSILIKGIKMPRGCQVCPISHWNKLDQMTGCELGRKHIPKDDEDFWQNDRPSWCPLVPVPPHGRLIDADAYLEKLMDTVNECVKKGVEIEAFRSFIEGAEVAIVDAMTMLNNMPTIIEAEVKE